MSDVRIATPDDLPEIKRLIRMMHAENGLFPFDDLKANDLLIRAALQLGPEPRPRIAVIGEPDRLEAMVGVMVGSVWYTSAKHLGDFAVYVSPEHRKSRHAIRLIAWMKDESERLGLPLLSGVVSKHHTDAKVALYGRYMTPVGALFVHGEDA